MSGTVNLLSKLQNTAQYTRPISQATTYSTKPQKSFERSCRNVQVCNLCILVLYFKGPAVSLDANLFFRLCECIVAEPY